MMQSLQGMTGAVVRVVGNATGSTICLVALLQDKHVPVCAALIFLLMGGILGMVTVCQGTAALFPLFQMTSRYQRTAPFGVMGFCLTLAVGSVVLAGLQLFISVTTALSNL